MTYDDDLIFGASESDVHVLFFDISVSDWVPAIGGNSDGGSGGAFFAGGYDDFLASPQGSGILEASDLSAFGVDEVNNHLWAVLDHASLFSLGLLVPIEPLDGDFDASGDVGAGDLNLVLFNWNIDGGVLTADWMNRRPDPGTLVGVPQLNEVLFNWGIALSAATVPEPAAETALLTLLVGGLTSLGTRRVSSYR